MLLAVVAVVFIYSRLMVLRGLYNHAYKFGAKLSFKLRWSEPRVRHTHTIPHPYSVCVQLTSGSINVWGKTYPVGKTYRSFLRRELSAAFTQYYQLPQRLLSYHLCWRGLAISCYYSSVVYNSKIGVTH